MCVCICVCVFYVCVCLCVCVCVCVFYVSACVCECVCVMEIPNALSQVLYILIYKQISLCDCVTLTNARSGHLLKQLYVCTLKPSADNHQIR